MPGVGCLYSAVGEVSLQCGREGDPTVRWWECFWTAQLKNYPIRLESHHCFTINPKNAQPKHRTKLVNVNAS